MKSYVTKAPDHGVIGAKGVKRLLNDKDAEIKTKYDDLSVDELKEALKNTFFYSGEFSDADMEEMDQIMSALDRKDPLEPLYTAEESLKQFQEAYGEELSSLGVRNTEEVMKETPAADLDVVCSVSEVKTVRPVRRRRLLRVALVAAATIVILFAIAATASAMGYNILGWVPKWNNDVLGFGENESPEPNALHDTRVIPAALEQMEINEPLYPSWLPEGFKIHYSEIELDPFFLHEGYSDGERYLTITIQPSSSTENIVFEKDTSPLSEYSKGNVVHYIFVDDNQVTASWQTDNYIVYITGNLSTEEIKRIIDSVYEVK